MLHPTSSAVFNSTNGFFPRRLHNHYFLLFTLLILSLFLPHSTTAADSSSFIYVGCSPTKYTPNSPYSTKVNSLLTSLLNSASYSYYNNFTTSPTTPDALYGLFQCRPDISNSDCSSCVSRAVSQLVGVLCSNSVGAAIQLDGCYVRYDNTTFLGVEDKSVVVSKCGPAGRNSDGVESVLSALLVVDGGDGQQQQQGEGVMFRVRQSGDVKGVAQCVGDLNAGQCQDCLGDVVRQLKSGCGMAGWGDVFLTKCYARFVVGGGSHASPSGQARGESIQDTETEKTLAILIGIIAAVALLVIFLAFLRRVCEGKGGK